MKFSNVKTQNAPAPIGPYSQGVIVGDLLFTCGQIAIVPETGEMRTGIDDEIKQVFTNLEGILSEAKLTFADVVSVRVYVTDLGDFAKINATMEKLFTKPYPVRTTVQVSALPKNAKVEIEIVAAIK